MPSYAGLQLLPLLNYHLFLISENPQKFIDITHIFENRKSPGCADKFQKVIS